MSLNVRLAEIIATRLWCFVDVGTQLQKHLHALDLPENSLAKLPFFFGTAFLRQNPPVPHSVTNLPWIFRSDSLMIFKTFPKTRRANRRPTSDFWEKKIQLCRLLLLESREDEWKLHHYIKQREIKKESSWKYRGKIMEILWTYSSYHISSTLYLVLSVHRKCCK